MLNSTAKLELPLDPPRGIRGKSIAGMDYPRMGVEHGNKPNGCAKCADAELPDAEFMYIPLPDRSPRVAATAALVFGAVKMIRARIAINASGSSWWRAASSAVEDFAFPATRLEIEVTETALVDHLDRASSSRLTILAPAILR
jgi:hypothetical protein